MRSGETKLQTPTGRNLRPGTKLNPEEKYNIAYQNPNYQKPSVGASVISYLLGKIKFNSVLDVGCGMGYTLLGFLKARKDARGIEVCDYLLKNFLKIFVDTDLVRKARIQNIPFEAETFDLIFCTDVLEHIVEEDIDISIKELIRVSKKYIFVTVATVPARMCPELELHETVKPVSWWDEKWKKYRLRRVATDLVRSSNEGEVYLWRKC